VAIGVKDALSHSHLIGVTGSGKSTVILNWIIQDLQAGRALLLVEPKGDLVRDVLARVPDHRVSDIVVIDPADIAPVGLNPLAHRGIASEVTVDLILAIFKGLFGDAIGPRTQDLLTAGIMTLATQSNLSLVALPRLFTDSHFRARLVQGIEDRLALDPFFAWYDNLSATEQSSVLAPLMNKLRVLLLRPSLRRVIGQPTPRFDLRQVFTEHRVVLVNAATGTLGGEAASLLGSIVVSLFWQATLERNRIAPERRHPVFLYVDEVQQYLHLPTDLADVLATARSMGVGLVAAHQSLSQLTSSSMRAALLANARSRLVMTTSHDDAVVLTKGDRRLDPEDVTSLGRFEAYASLLSRNEPQPYTSIRTLPAPPAIRDPEEVRDRSRRAWGIPAGEIDAALDDMVGNDPRRPSSGQVVTDLGVRRRRPKGPGGSP
jgi:hypothetical protein